MSDGDTGPKNGENKKNEDKLRNVNKTIKTSKDSEKLY
jgi:hypothetical protein